MPTLVMDIDAVTISATFVREAHMVARRFPGNDRLILRFATSDGDRQEFALNLSVDGFDPDLRQALADAADRCQL